MSWTLVAYWLDQWVQYWLHTYVRQPGDRQRFTAILGNPAWSILRRILRWEEWWMGGGKIVRLIFCLLLTKNASIPAIHIQVFCLCVCLHFFLHSPFFLSVLRWCSHSFMGNVSSCTSWPGHYFYSNNRRLWTLMMNGWKHTLPRLPDRLQCRVFSFFIEVTGCKSSGLALSDHSSRSFSFFASLSLSRPFRPSPRCFSFI